METEGQFAPATEAALRECYEDCGPAAQTAIREAVVSMGFDRDEYRERVDSDAIESARDAIFASLLRVHVGTMAEFEDWRDGDGAALEVTVAGSEHVDNAVWHHAPVADAAVAATFQDERDAAVATLRRQAFGRVYREALEG